MEVASAHVLANPIGVPEEYVSVHLENSSNYLTTNSLNLLVHTSESEVKKFMNAYNQDPHFSKVYKALRQNYHPMNPPFSQYQVGDNGLLYFIDWAKKLRLCVPKELQLDIIKENHDEISNGAHAGYAKTYNRIASVYYWPKMSQTIKKYTDTCDICQKTKPRRHGPRGYLQPIPIPSQPFEVITMDFIVDLPESNGHNAILVIVNKLTKYAHFIPCTTTINEQETAKLLHNHIWCHYSLPQQIISDRDSRWTGTLWSHLTNLLGIKHVLTTAHHPQAYGQTEIMNQILEIGVRAYINPVKDNWSSLLPEFAYSYNTSIHTSTSFSPAYLLRGCQPLSSAELLAGTSEFIPRLTNESLRHLPLWKKWKLCAPRQKMC
jgi:hypothetical protein